MKIKIAVGIALIVFILVVANIFAFSFLEQSSVDDKNIQENQAKTLSTLNRNDEFEDVEFEINDLEEEFENHLVPISQQTSTKVVPAPAPAPPQPAPIQTPTRTVTRTRAS